LNIQGVIIIYLLFIFLPVITVVVFLIYVGMKRSKEYRKESGQPIKRPWWKRLKW